MFRLQLLLTGSAYLGYSDYRLCAEAIIDRLSGFEKGRGQAEHVPEMDESAQKLIRKES